MGKESKKVRMPFSVKLIIGTLIFFMGAFLFIDYFNIEPGRAGEIIGKEIVIIGTLILGYFIGVKFFNWIKKRVILI